MLVKSKSNGREHNIDQETWDKIVSRGQDKLYTIVVAEEVSEIPQDLEQHSYGTLIAKARKAFNNEDYQKAMDLYVQASELNATDFVLNKIESLEDLVN